MSGAKGFSFSNGLLEWPIPANEAFSCTHRLGQAPLDFGLMPRGAVNLFDAPPGEFKVMYAAERLAGAFIDTVLRRQGRIVARAFVEMHQWTKLSSSRPLILAKAFAEGMQFHGLALGLDCADSRTRNHAFAMAVYTAFDHVDGIAYQSRHDTAEVCYMLFERSMSPEPLRIHGSLRLDEMRSEVDTLMRRYGAVWDLSPRPSQL